MILEIAEFYKWLTELPHDYVVGIAYDSRQCPLVNYLEFKGMLCAKVSIRTASWIGSEGETYMPQWAIDFVDYVDSIGVDKKIYPVQCIEALQFGGHLPKTILQ